MSDIDGIYSVRLVIADFYMEKPVFGLDPCYSELRGKEIKRVRSLTVSSIMALIMCVYIYSSLIGAHCAHIWRKCQWPEMLHACAWCLSLLLHTLR